MAQHDYVIANQSGAAFRADLNNGLAAIVTLNSGATEPSTTYAYMFWADTTAGLLKMRNGANNAWITLRELDGTLVFEDGTAAAPGLSFASDLNTGIYRIGADSIGITTGGVNRLLANSAGQVAVTLAGSAGTPSFTKDDDLNTGLFYPAADTLAISAGGTEAARIDSSRRLLVGTTATGDDNSALQIRNDNGSQIEVFRASADAVGTIINCAKSRGTASAPAEVNSGDVLGQINFRGYDGAAWQTAARIEAKASASWTDAGDTTDNPGALNFYTVLNGTSSLTAKVTIDGDGYTAFRGSCAAEVFPVVIGGYDDNGEHGHLIINGYGSNVYAGDIYFEKYRGTPSSPTIVQSGDILGGIHFNGYDGTAPRRAADISIEVDGTPGANDMPGRIVLSTTADGASGSTERMRINSSGNLLFGKTASNIATAGVEIFNTGTSYHTRDSEVIMILNRLTNDGELIAFRQAGTQEGGISVSGTTVSYNGAHLSRWSQLPGGAEREEILRGTVLSNIDEMCEWGEENNEQLNRMKVSDVEGDVNVAGVFQAWDDGDETYTNDFYCAMTGDFIIRIAEGVTVQRGDLLMSAGDGTAKPQDDDIIRSKTVAKVTSTQVSCTYEDGSYCVPCVLMAC